MTRLANMSIRNECEDMFNAIQTQIEFELSFEDYDGNEFGCCSESDNDIEFWYIDGETQEDNYLIVNNDEIETIEDIENYFKQLKEEIVGASIVREGYIGDIQTDDDILEDIYYDIMDDIDSGDQVRYKQEEGNEWEYIVEDNRNDGFTVIVHNLEEDTTASNSYTYKEFIDFSFNDFVTDINEMCYYAY